MTNEKPRSDAGGDKPALPRPPSAKSDATPRRDAPDLRLEEIEEKHVPKDRNIFDK